MTNLQVLDALKERWGLETTERTVQTYRSVLKAKKKAPRRALHDLRLTMRRVKKVVEAAGGVEAVRGRVESLRGLAEACGGLEMIPDWLDLLAGG